MSVLRKEERRNGSNIHGTVANPQITGARSVSGHQCQECCSLRNIPGGDGGDDASEECVSNGRSGASFAGLLPF